MREFTKEQELILDFTKNAICFIKYKINTGLIKDINWDELLKIAMKQKIFMMLYDSISSYIPTQYKASYEHKYFEIIMMNNIKINELKRIIKAANDNNISLFLIKGLALSQLIYNDINMRQFSDIDLLVHEADMEKLYYLINDMGYFLYTGYDEVLKCYNTINKPVFLYSDDFHEFLCLKCIDAHCNIFVEIKRASSAIPLKYIGDFFENFEYFHISDNKIKTSNLLYTFLHLLANSYNTYEPDTRILSDYNMRDIIDPYIFIQKYKGELDWIKILDLSEKYEISHKIYYMLNLLTNFYGQIISNEIIESFSPAKITYEFKGNMDGSMDSWESDFIFRLFNHAERNDELARCRKKRIYGANDYRIDKVQNESFSITTNREAYNHLYVKLLQWDINYMFFCDNVNLYLNIIIDNTIYEQLGHYYIMVQFIDNNFESKIFYRTIMITKYEALNIQSTNLQLYGYQFIKLENYWMIKIIIPFSHLDMRFKDSQNRIHYYLEFREKIGIDAYRCLTKKDEFSEYNFLEIPGDLI